MPYPWWDHPTPERRPLSLHLMFGTAIHRALLEEPTPPSQPRFDAIVNGVLVELKTAQRGIGGY